MLVVLVVLLSAPAVTEPEAPKIDEISIPFVTVLGHATLVNRPYTWVQEFDFLEDRERTDASMTLSAGARVLAHLDFGGHVVPYFDGAVGGGGTFTFDASAGVIAGARFLTRLTLVGIERRERQVGNYIEVTETKTTTTWGEARYPLVVGGQAGIGVQGFGSNDIKARGTDFKGALLPESITPRLELGGGLVGQHHVSALLTFDLVRGVVGLRGHVLQRIPIGIFWVGVGLTYEVAFNNRQSRPYDFMVGGTLGIGFSRG